MSTMRSPARVMYDAISRALDDHAWNLSTVELLDLADALISELQKEGYHIVGHRTDT